MDQKETQSLELAASTLSRLSRGAAASFELYLERRAATRIDARQQKIDTLTRSEDLGLAIRVFKQAKSGGRMGFSFTTSLDPHAIERAARSAWEIADFMPEDPWNGLTAFDPAGLKKGKGETEIDHEGLASPVDHKISLALDLEARCLAADSRIKNVRAAQLTESLTTVSMLDSKGGRMQYSRTIYSASISCKAEDKGDSRMGGHYGFANRLSQLDLIDVSRQAAINAAELLGAGTAPTLNCPAVLRNDVMADLIDFLSSSFSAEQVDKGRSLISVASLGKKLFSPCITLVDDGLMPGGLGTSPFDGEGTPSTTTELIRSGVASNLLCDLYYARKLSLAATGSSARGIKSPPSISTSNLYLKAGQTEFAALCAGIQKGVLITDLRGLHTANPVTGDFSLGASGFLIEDGKPTRPMSGFAVAGNILDVLSKVELLGSDLKFFGSTGSPSALISEIAIGGNAAK